MNDTYTNWITIPRHILTDCRDGRISVPERNLLIYLRCNGNPYGVAVVSFEQLSKEAFNKDVKANYINKLLLSLKSKKYISYLNRQGRRGSFEIHFDEWIIPGNKIKKLESSFDSTQIRGLDVTQITGYTEVKPEVEPFNQKFTESKTGLSKEERFNSIHQLVRSYDTDTEKDKDTNYVRTIKKVRVTEFVPKSEVDDKLKRVAEEIGEEYMGFVFWVYGKRKDDGIWTMQKIAADLVDKPDVLNKRKYFNKEVRRQLGLLASETFDV